MSGCTAGTATGRCRQWKNNKAYRLFFPYTAVDIAHDTANSAAAMTGSKNTDAVLIPPSSALDGSANGIAQAAPMQE